MTDLAEKLAGLSKLQDGINRPHWERHQEKLAKILFEWWWSTGQGDPAVQPQWDACLDRIQAFWMDGAWRVMSG